MPSLIIRNLASSVISALAEIAQGEGMSREEYVRQLLIEESSVARVLVFSEGGKLDLAASREYFNNSPLRLEHLAADVRRWADDTFADSGEVYKAKQGLLVYGAVRVGREAKPDESDKAFIEGFGKGARVAIKQQIAGAR